MNLCKNCKYFGEELTDFDEETGEYGATGFHVCGFVQHKNGLMDDDSPFPKDATVGVEDGSGYFARLVVKGEFGCIEWTEAEAECAESAADDSA